MHTGALNIPGPATMAIYVRHGLAMLPCSMAVLR
ncbi:MAG: hypothetical protein RI925_500 [Pseudomonadota bacterium]